MSGIVIVSEALEVRDARFRCRWVGKSSKLDRRREGDPGIMDEKMYKLYSYLSSELNNGLLSFDLLGRFFDERQEVWLLFRIQ